MELIIKFIDKESVEHTYERKTTELDWVSVEPGRVIVFEDIPSGVAGVETRYSRFGSIKKTILLQALSDEQVKEIEDQHKRQMEMMMQRQRAQQSGLIIPGVNAQPGVSQGIQQGR